MDFLRPASWEEALAAKAEHPTAVPIAGGTDVMVEINFDHRRPEYLLDLNRIGELARVGGRRGERPAGRLRPVHPDHGAPARPSCPGLALASHTVASPQIRNRGGVGGNLGTASPAGDAHPALLAAGAEVEVESVRGTPAHPDRRVLHRREAQRARRRRADPGRPHQEGGRPAAVLQGRHPQRDGHRRVRLRPRAAPRDPHGPHRHRLGRARPRSGRRPPRSS